MPKNPTQGTVQFATEIDAKLVAAIKERAKAEKRTIRGLVELMALRYLNEVPPPEVLELPKTDKPKRS